MERYGIIDLGSNSVRMNIVNVYKNGSYSLVDQAKVMVRLSEGLADGGTLKPEPIARTLNAIKLFNQLIEAYGVTKVAAVATAAVRQAANASDFLGRALEEHQMAFEVISGEDEAYYDYLGIINTIDLKAFLMIDTGGGSTELAWVVDREIKASVSLPFGSVILTERFLSGDNREKGIEKAEKFVRKAYKDVPWLKDAKGLPVVGLGGSLRSVAKVHRGKDPLSNVSLHNYRMPGKELEALLTDIVNTPPDKVSYLPGIGKDRADIIAGGVLPLKVLSGYVDLEQFVVSGNGLREGVFFSRYFKEKGMPLIVPSVLDHSLENVRKRFNVDNPHTAHVRKLALRLFDALKVLGPFDDSDRILLDAAGHLHDIGMHIEYYNHHRHGFYLTLNARLCGLTNEEIIKVAVLVGHHRESKLKEDLDRFKSALGKEMIEHLRRLAVLLQIAERIDRSESQVVDDLAVTLSKEEALIQLISEKDTELECVATMRIAEDFEKAFGVRMRVVRGG